MSSHPEFPLREAVAEFLKELELERRLSAHTVRAYRRDCGDFGDGVQERLGREPLVADLERGQLRAHLAMLYPKAPATVARALSALRTLSDFCWRRGWLSDNAASRLRGPRVTRPVPMAPTETETQRVVEGPLRPDWFELRDRALVEVLYGAGIRVGEACRLRPGDIRWAEGEATLRILGKGGRERLAVIGRAGAAALREWTAALGNRRDHDATLFVGVRGGALSARSARQIVYDRSAAVLGRRFGPHTLRHACAMHMLSHGADIRLIQAVLGHRSIRSTQIYTHLDIAWLDRVYRRCHPRAHCGTYMAHTSATKPTESEKNGPQDGASPDSSAE